MNQQPPQPQREQYGQGGQYDQQLSQRGQAEPTQQPHYAEPSQGTSQPGMQPQHQQQGQGHRRQQPMEGQGRQSQGMQTQGMQTQGMQAQETQPQGTQYQGTQPQGTQSSVTHSFRDHLTDELRIALEDFNELTHVAAWCAKECASAGIGTCARICQDIAEIAELNEMLIARDSMFGPEVAETFLRVGRDALPELRRYQQRHPHIVETVSTLERTMNACSTLLEMGGRGGQQTGTHAGGQRPQ